MYLRGSIPGWGKNQFVLFVAILWIFIFKIFRHVDYDDMPRVPPQATRPSGNLIIITIQKIINRQGQEIFDPIVVAGFLTQLYLRVSLEEI